MRSAVAVAMALACLIDPDSPNAGGAGPDRDRAGGSPAGTDCRPAAMPDGVLDPARGVGAMEGRPPVRIASISPRREATCRP